MVDVHTADDIEIEAEFYGYFGKSDFVCFQEEMYEFIVQNKLNVNYFKDRGGMWYVDSPIHGRVFRRYLKFALMAMYILYERPTVKETRRRKRKR